MAATNCISIAYTCTHTRIHTHRMGAIIKNNLVVDDVKKSQHLYIHILPSIHIHIHVHTYIYTYIYIYVDIHIHIHIRMKTPAHTCTYTYTYICIYIYVHIHIHKMGAIAENIHWL